MQAEIWVMKLLESTGFVTEVESQGNEELRKSRSFVGGQRTLSCFVRVCDCVETLVQFLMSYFGLFRCIFIIYLLCIIK